MNEQESNYNDDAAEAANAGANADEDAMADAQEQEEDVAPNDLLCVIPRGQCDSVEDGCVRLEYDASGPFRYVDFGKLVKTIKHEVLNRLTDIVVKINTPEDENVATEMTEKFFNDSTLFFDEEDEKAAEKLIVKRSLVRSEVLDADEIAAEAERQRRGKEALEQLFKRKQEIPAAREMTKEQYEAHIKRNNEAREAGIAANATETPPAT